MLREKWGQTGWSSKWLILPCGYPLSPLLTISTLNKRQDRFKLKVGLFYFQLWKVQLWTLKSLKTSMWRQRIKKATNKFKANWISFLVVCFKRQECQENFRKLKITQIFFTCFIKLLKIHFPIVGLLSSVVANIQTLCLCIVQSI